ncbi:DUF805 domain-containing protein [Capnocytophaga canimorsus]|uniref:Uncharacterized protein n=1 Tax=Capnocytophaga canimorsus TaxID=28188 RepID=A0A250G1Q2_9FLAO|nr:DUF805 domain-containing protein [Capnocytophaga canimorsus]ATA91171.1 hypothetical protein CGC56_02715 [Capnocytophaga canimorsus]ATA93184.1 hypothetical protein CGC54_01900 [Capnocytophaga canimorsus]AYW36599.1 DUF805 domain-containing protein [Capnocytophaga canimorsus]WGU68061.1 DUF805 domain-containing protein [Capnocytophaga canimorsus]WGU70835.1 DUF805 domain-containing protein [Capnocytophaga canimorsus]
MNWYLKVLKQYADFKGRARRKEYWMFTLFNCIIFFVLGFISGLIETTVLVNICYLAIIVPSIAVGVRRMHDVGKSGWFILVPIYNLVLCLTEGERGPNQYGPDPKAQ